MKEVLVAPHIDAVTGHIHGYIANEFHPTGFAVLSEGTHLGFKKEFLNHPVVYGALTFLEMLVEPRLG